MKAGTDEVRAGRVVALRYRIEAEDGTVLERSDIPVQYVHGGGREGLLPALERALEGRRPGETLRVVLPPEEGFGEADPGLRVEQPIEEVPPPFRQVGAEVEMVNDRGEWRTFRVTRIADGRVTIDGNHPLAGRTLVFHLVVDAVREATPEERAEGVARFAPMA
ncbi:FKBP-type peptidyl-prolyl cis-trans isomerase [Inmirania thermothiophila]|uniref:Peptidyl-prolyl cis-trans isomerase n=1 Tax=Inmirania thermothiophila TaxID=1750597 RepID=A0A3N1YAA3_9GAMM|nr:FKBP-type peptidyl-prolyl cis-trans isomerase [Inmirania thermothiophila]ROR34327.1 FKBP-type peptidyl prolyl cis-trans isomerase /apo-metallochaperone SlyD [Inmirania thermothiophila]